SGADSQIMGVVGDVRDQGLDRPAQPRIYASIFQRPNYSVAVFLRMRSDLNTIKETVTQTVRTLDPELPVYGVRTMDELISASMARRRFALSLMSMFAGVALFLAALGVYGVMAFLVNQRVQEFGIRMALGAQTRDILLLALRPAAVLLSAGTIIGVGASIFVTRLMSSLLFGVSANDPFTFAEELPFAGHPTLGTALSLQAANSAVDQVSLDLKFGKIPVRFSGDHENANRNRADGQLFGEMRQRDPEFGAILPREEVARVI